VIKETDWDISGMLSHRRARAEIVAGISLLTPEMVHYGEAGEVLKFRKKVLYAAYEVHSEKFVRKEPPSHYLKRHGLIHRRRQQR